jgi:hypothetical protein
VKANQPELLAALAGAFDDAGVSPWERRLARAERQRAASLDKGHGRLERRTLVSTTALNDYAGWPGVAQCFRLERRRTLRGRTTTQVAYGITSLGPGLASAKRLLGLTRRHWRIENGLFWVRDVTLGEDACRVRSGAAPLILSTLRNTVVNLLNGLGVSNKAAALRRHAAHPYEALRLVRPFG